MSSLIEHVSNNFRSVPLPFYVTVFVLFNGLSFLGGLLVLRDIRRKGTSAQLPFPPVYAVLSFALLVTSTFIWWLAMLHAHPLIPSMTIILILSVLILTLAAMLTTILLVFAPHLNERFGNVWVKALDFAYLGCALVGFARLINTSPFVTDHVDLLTSVALLFVALAIAVRLSKATIEVFFSDWY